MPNKFTDSEMREEWNIWFSNYPGTPSIGEIEQWFHEKFSEYKAYLKGEIEGLGHQQDDGSIWCEMDKVLDLLN